MSDPTEADMQAAWSAAVQAAQDGWERTSDHAGYRARWIAAITAALPHLACAAWRPEDGDTKCQRCHGPNSIWFADSDLWNRVVGGDPNVEAGGVLCIRCFATQANEPLHVTAASADG